MKVKSKYYISLEQFEEVFTNLKKLKETKYKENDGIIIKFDQNSNSLLQYTPTGLHVWFHYGRHTYHVEVYDFSESLFNKNNIKKLYNKYSKMLLGLNKAHYENTPLKIDFTDTSVNLGVTCVAF
ncbi:hypothetical protein HYO65_gp273 [Tenacibaculum phage PTm1]|uniref:Uncharacterized protein n=1 Tax=Tenacibaculum phage PTm1 TaxID=2547425 RepID=A0A5S9EQM5_9CAUD|nr:hypothetical protein HYO65_gp273 [Tenacibaculum phage PTm1]BBI90665.1 hypothetical protein [Tenacibaculum phage PTm1]